jgi:iron complex outermembrane recepter protein
MRSVIVATAVSLAIVGLAAADPADAAIKKQTNIPAQDLGSALQQLMKQRELHIIYISEDLRDLRTQGVVGELTAGEALKGLLSGTGLTYRYLDDQTVTIMPIATAPAAASASADASDNTSPALEEIVVTAQKRVERLQEVPVPVTAISAETLLDSNQLRFQDYYTRIPGLSVTNASRGAPVLAIRGIATSPANPTVAVMVDDVPLGSSTSFGFGFQVPDLDPSDLARIEVLRGPQGTFYGASSLGGLLKFVTVDPSTDAVSGRVQGTLDSVRNGNELGYNFRGAVNVPLGETWAMRASGFTRHDAGYIDDPSRGLDGVNEATLHGGRLSSLWQPSENLSLKVSALLQESESEGTAFVYRLQNLSDLQQSALRDTGWFDRKTEAYSANLTTRFANLTLTALSGYNVDSFSTSTDFSPTFASRTQTQFGVSGAAIPEVKRTSKFTQELRLSGPIGPRFEWLVGAFYADEKTRWEQDIVAVEPATGAVVGTWILTNTPTTYDEYAAFANLTINLTERFDVQIGGRQSETTQTYRTTQSGPLLATGQLVIPGLRIEEDAFTYLLTPRCRISPDLMVYARLASGYRAGGPNTNFAQFGLPPQYDPDETQNYEIGVKGSAFENALTFDASVYYIDWKGIQLSLAQNGVSYFANGGRARSQGVELAVESRPLWGLTIAGWVAWNDAELTENFPVGSTAFGVSGDRLPFGSRFSGNLSVDKQFPLTSTVLASLGASVSYVGERKGVFRAVPQRESLPAYATTDVHAGLTYESWALNLFVNNVADRRGVLAGGLGFSPAFAFSFIQPRTAGLSVARTF